MITIKHYPSDWDTMPDVSWSVRDDAAIAANHPCYYTGYDIPNYPMPAIRYHDMIINWHGEHRLIVVFDGWHGFATAIEDCYFE